MNALPSIEQQAKSAIEAIKDYHRGRGRKVRHNNVYPLQMERDIVVLWGMYRGWSMPVMADAVMVSIPAIERVRRKFINEPYAIFRCPVLHKVLRADKPLWTCQFCGEQMREAERKAREHVASHVLSSDIIELNGVMPRGAR